MVTTSNGDLQRQMELFLNPPLCVMPPIDGGAHSPAINTKSRTVVKAQLLDGFPERSKKLKAAMHEVQEQRSAVERPQSQQLIDSFTSRKSSKCKLSVASIPNELVQVPIWHGCEDNCGFQ